ncbi:MAG: type II secretion system protein [Pseudomonadota bacterium]
MKQRGFTLVGALVTITILGVLFTFLGKALPFLVRSRLRTESKSSFAKSSKAIASLVAKRVAAVLDTKCPDSSNPGSDFATLFNTSPPLFPGTNTRLLIESGSTAPGLIAFPNPPASKPEIAAALAACKASSGMSIPGPSDDSPFIFCLTVNSPSNTTSTDFIDSQNAFLQVRVELFSQDDSQSAKILGTTRNCTDFKSLAAAKQQIKINYAGFWKKNGDNSDLAYFSFESSSIFNRSEIQ